MWSEPAATATTFARPLTCTGVLRVVNELSPIWPLLLRPTVKTVPSGFRRTVWPEPPASVCAPAMEATTHSRLTGGTRGFVAVQRHRQAE